MLHKHSAARPFIVHMVSNLNSSEMAEGRMNEEDVPVRIMVESTGEIFVYLFKEQ